MRPSIFPAPSSSTSTRCPTATIRCRTCCRREHKFASRMQSLGLGDGNRFVVYDNSPLHSAARAWWMLKIFGAHYVAILDGGLQKWKAEGRPLESGTAAGPPRPFHRLPRRRRGGRQGACRGLLERATHEIVDARGAGRFAGEEPKPRPGLAPRPHSRARRTCRRAACSTPTIAGSRATRCAPPSIGAGSISTSRWSRPAARESPRRACCSAPICSARRMCGSTTAAGPNGAPIPATPKATGPA